VDSYGPVIDAVIFPYRDDPLRNTRWTTCNVIARFDDLTLTGCTVSNPGFETTGPSRLDLSRGGNGAVLGSIYTYDPAYSTTVLNAVAQLYQ
jgi:hypothetical protein